MTISTSSLSPMEAYRLLISAVIPRPIAFVTSLNASKVVNAAPFSFFNAITGNPPLIMISVERKNGVQKHTAENILARKEFVVNLVDEELTHAMNIASASFPPDISEIEQANIRLLPSARIGVPRIEESPVNLECTLCHHLAIGNEPTDLLIGEVVQFHVKDELYDEGAIDHKNFKPIARLGNNAYMKAGEFFELERFRYEAKQ
jgi:flavin reductase (DIM6/NTAB) family NADH-FMN oxidoreductase RutF